MKNSAVNILSPASKIGNEFFGSLKEFWIFMYNIQYLFQLFKLNFFDFHIPVIINSTIKNFRIKEDDAQ